MSSVDKCHLPVQHDTALFDMANHGMIVSRVDQQHRADGLPKSEKTYIARAEWALAIVDDVGFVLIERRNAQLSAPLHV
jgi:hypothetical protein